jgi:EAL domain-containing protein (putative c-di-GMP-specific phosphodiesterase class I)
VAEKLGLIRTLDAWVLRQACRQLAHWHLHGLPVRVAVNLSAQEFCDPGLAGRVAEILRQEGAPAAGLELEITEGTAMAPDCTTAPALQELRQLGVALSIDDFGTGHSSLARLRDLQVSRLKIDRSFVVRREAGPRERNLVRAIVSMAQALGLRTGRGRGTPESAAHPAPVRL